MLTTNTAIDQLIATGDERFGIALVYGVVYPLAPSQTRVLQWLQQIWPPGRHIRQADVRTIVAELVSLGVLQPAERGGGYQATPNASIAMLRHALAQRLLAPLLERVIGDNFAHEWSNADRVATMLLRCAAVTRDWRWLNRIHRPVDWGALLQPELVAAIAELPEPQRYAAILRCTNVILDRLQDADPFLAVCEALPNPDEFTIANIALLRILQGRFADLERWLNSLAAPDPVVQASVRALLHALHGRDAEAMAGIERTLELARGTSRKRVLHPPYSVFSLGMLALLRLNLAESRALFDDLMTNAAKLKVSNRAMEVLHVAARLCQPDPPRFQMPADDYDDLSCLFRGLALCWSDSTDYPGNRQFLEQLVQLAARAEATGFHWIAAELGQILHTAGHAGGNEALHQRLGTRSLITAIPRVEAWEHGLNALEQLASTVRGRKQKIAAPERTQTRRLAWVITDAGFGDFDVEAREQVLKTNGWTRGKPVSLKKLREAPGEYDFLTDQDRAVAATIATALHRWSGHREFHVPLRGLFLLAGHPAVVDERLRPLDVVAAEPELVVNERGDATISAELTPYPDDEGEFQLLYEDGDARLTVLRLNASARRLAQIIPPEGLILPATARARLLEAVGDLASDVRVHGGLAGETANARVVAADARPWIQLTPVGAGLSVRVLVEPIPGSGMQFDPGAGGELVIAHLEGEALQTRRALEAERTLANELVQACPAFAAAGMTRWRCELTDPDECLEALDALQRADARCLWPEGETLRLAGRATAASMKLVVRSSKEWFSASGELEVDEHRAVGLQQLLRLLGERPRSRFLQIGDGEFVALGETLRQQLALLDGLLVESGKSLRLHPLAAPALDELLADVDLDADAAWQQQVARMRDAQAYEPVVPGTLQADLRPYQRDGILWLARLAQWGVGACLADDMGLGKTIQALALLLTRAPGGPALAVVPTSLVDNWRLEARRFAPTLDVRVYGGTALERADLLDQLGPFSVLVCTYGLLQNDAESIAARTYHTVILDEAQAIRNAATKRAQAVRALQADFRLALTGTPVQNNLMDLHALFGFLNPGLLGSANQFRAGYALPIERDQDPAARARLSRLIAPFVLRRTKTEVLDDLPSRTEIVRSVTLSPEEAAFYEALRRQAVADLEGLAETTSEGSRQLQVLAHLTRLRLACCHPQLVQDTGIRDSAKLTEFMTLLDELLQNRHKVLVFSQFVKHLKLIEAALIEAGVSYQYLDGQTPRQQRSERIQAFQAGQGDVFLISLKAGGTGLNLTAADYVIHMDPWWNPAAEDQASDRAHRIGQTRPVTIYRLVARGTIEEQIVDLHHRKRDLAEQLLQDTDAVGRLDASELLSLLREPLTG